MTRCEHVRKLNPPYTPGTLNEIRDTLMMSHDAASGYPQAIYPPYGRYAAEYWIMNDAGKRSTEDDRSIHQWSHVKPRIKKQDICTRHPQPLELAKEVS